MDQFFHNINRRLDDIAKKQELNESVQPVAEKSTGDYSAKKARAGKDIGKPGKMFSKIAKSAGERYGSKERGEKVAGAVLAKLRAKKESVEQDGDVMDYLNDKLKDFDAQQTDESALQAYLGKKKYGDEGMKALQKAGREHAGKEKMDRIRSKYDKMDEADMEEGNKFAYNVIKAKAAGLKKADLDGDGDMETVREYDFDDKDDFDHRAKAGDTVKTSKGKLIKTDKGVRHERGYTDEPEAADTDADKPKKKGRPAGTKRAIGAKGPSGKSKLLKKAAIKETDVEEDLDTDGVMMNRPSNMSSEGIEGVAMIDKGEYDREGEMAKQQIHTIVRAAKNLHKMLGDDDNLPEWVQKKITLASNYIDSVSDYMTSQRAESGMEEPIAEKAVSVAQRRAAGIAHAAQKGEIPKSKLRGASKEMAKMPKGELHKFAVTKEKGLPKKVKEGSKPDFLDLDKDGNKAEPMKQAAKQAKGKGKSKEETDEGAMSGAEVKDVKNPAPKGKGGMQFGKGVYESMNKKYTQMLNEGMNVSINAGSSPDGEGTKNITVSADGEDAEALAALLKMAGMGSYKSVCPGCGKSDCGCEEDLDENSPDWPTNTEKIDADPNLRTYAGGLNGPKSTGQSTTPVLASQLRRQASMDESVELERSLFKLYQNYKAQ